MNISIKNDSCFNYLKTIQPNSINLILIDPPYEVSRDTNFAKSDPKGNDTDRFRMSMDFGDWDKNFTNLDVVIKECYRILKKGGTLICFYDLWKITTLKNYFEVANFKQLRFIEWIKTNPVPINSQTNYLTNSREIAILGVKGGKPTFHSKYDNGIYDNTYQEENIDIPENGGEIYKFPICHDKGRFHPTQKPIQLIKELIEKHSNENDIVLDCFLGSGTTAVACILSNRNFYGCEISPQFYNKARNRIEQYCENTCYKIKE